MSITFLKGFDLGHLVASTWLFPLLEAQDWKHTGSDVLGTCASKSHHTGGWRAVFLTFHPSQPLSGATGSDVRRSLDSLFQAEVFRGLDGLDGLDRKSLAKKLEA